MKKILFTIMLSTSLTFAAKSQHNPDTTLLFGKNEITLDDFNNKLSDGTLVYSDGKIYSSGNFSKYYKEYGNITFHINGVPFLSIPADGKNLPDIINLEKFSYKMFVLMSDSYYYR